MGLQNCQINLDNSSATYFPGQVVSGRVEFNFNSTKKIRGIQISYKGEAYTHWTEYESYRTADGKTSRRSVSYIGSEEYFHYKYYVIGGSSDNTIELPPGQHVYNFSYTLPKALPSSFEGGTGYVRYTVKATIDRPWKFDQTIKAAYTVIAHLDINLNPLAREPATLTMEKYFCCLFCKSGPLTGIFRVPYTGYVSGQTIPLTLEIDNISNVDVTNMKVKLKKIVSFHSRYPSRKTKTQEITVSEVKLGTVVRGRDSSSINSSITIPSLPPSNLQYCGIIDLVYQLQVTVEVDGAHQNMYGTLPVTIGTIPFNNMIPMTSPPANNVPNFEIRPVLGWIPAPANTPPVYDLPPPSYEESQFGPKTILDENDSEHTMLNHGNPWAPSYPVYHFPLPTAPPVTSMVPSVGQSLPKM